MGADTQLSMVSWINVLVRAIQKVQRTGPMHLIPIKQKHPEIIRIESLSLDNHQHPSQGSGLYEVSAAEVVDGLLMEEEEMPMSPPPLVNQTPSSSPTPNTTLRSASSSSSSSVHSSSGDNSSSRFVVPGNSRSFDDYFVPSTEKRAAGGDLVRRPTWATTNMMPAAKYYVSSEPPARKSLDNQHYRREDSWGRSSSAPYNVEEMTGILRARTTIGPDHPRNQFQQQHLFDSSSDTRRASNDGF